MALDPFSFMEIARWLSGISILWRRLGVSRVLFHAGFTMSESLDCNLAPC